MSIKNLTEEHPHQTCVQSGATQDYKHTHVKGECCAAQNVTLQDGAKHKHDHGCCADCGGGKTLSRGLQIVFLSVSLASLIASFVLGELQVFPVGSLFKWFDLAYIAVILCGYPIVKQAVISVSRKKITSNLLITVSMLACIVLEVLMLSEILPADEGHSNIFAAGEVALLMALGELIEDFTVGKARSGIERLMKLAPPTAKYRVGDELIEKPLAEVKIGDTVTVLAGDVISVDGEILSGETAVDESVMTGESVPVDKKTGDLVYGGTMNVWGAIEVRVTRSADEMAVTKLKKLVEEAEGKKAPISQVADRWARVIVPAAAVIAVVVFVLSYFWFTNGALAASILRGVTVLVVFCPCALALATPTAVAAGLGASARRGILIKSGAALEVLAGVKTVAFDKTGTLTEGRLSVDGLFAADGDESRLMALAGACERLSEHPIAKAIVSYCSERVSLPKSDNTGSLIGSGVTATVKGKKITVVKWAALSGMGVDFSACNTAAEAFLANGKTLTAVVEDGILLGLIALSDTLKPGAAMLISRLNKAGIATIMLTGDNVFAAKAAAEQLGIDYRAALLPEQKLQAIIQLKSNGRVCMVGDGVNDAPALAAADCSIAMAALGSDAAIETADAALMTGDVKKVGELALFSRRVLRTIHVNIVLSLLISFAAVIISAMGVLTPVWGALVHNLSTVLVVLNSSALLLWGKGGKQTKSSGKQTKSWANPV